MSKIYIVAKSNVEGIQEIRSVHRTYNGAWIEWMKLCNDMIEEDEGFIEYELTHGSDNTRRINRMYDIIDVLKTYDREAIEEKLYPGETPCIIESELKK
jgi:hypothetical protein